VHTRSDHDDIKEETRFFTDIEDGLFDAGVSSSLAPGSWHLT
jgi:hypothetical protein